MGLEHTFETPDTLEPARIVATDGYHRAMRIPVYQARERFNNERNPTDHALDAVPDLETGSTHAVYPRTAPASEPWIETRTGSKGWAALCGQRVKVLMPARFTDGAAGNCEPCTEALRVAEHSGKAPFRSMPY
jgi:hypothetical protein